MNHFWQANAVFERQSRCLSYLFWGPTGAGVSPLASILKQPVSPRLSTGRTLCVQYVIVWLSKFDAVAAVLFGSI